MPTVESQKIIWAVDPFAENISLQESAARAIKSLTQGIPTEVEPVYLSNFYPIEIAFAAGTMVGMPPDMTENTDREIQALGQKTIDELVKRFSIPGIKPLKVLSEPYRSLGLATEKLIAHAKKTNAGLIVLNTRARKGLERWIMGSFAETLTLNSNVPLFIVNPLWKSSGNFKHIFFPTDFSPESRLAFKKVLILAKSLGSRVTIFHKIRQKETPAIGMAYSVAALYRQVIKEEVKARKEEGQKWVNEATKMGVKARFTIDTHFGSTIEEAILAKAKMKPGMIAMAARSGRISAIIAGSVARKILRSSPYPVWIFHSENKKRQQPIFTVAEPDVTGDLHIPRGT